MGDPNNVVTILKILELPKYEEIKKSYTLVYFKAQLSQRRNVNDVYVIVYDRNVRETFTNWKINDYFLVEGSIFFSLNNFPKHLQNSSNMEQDVFIIASKIYPYILIN